MTSKENKGGELKNEQVEQDLKVHGHPEGGGYHGSQDTGDTAVRQKGTEVQQRDGLPGKDHNEDANP